MQLLESIALLQWQVDDLKNRLFGRKSERRSQDPVGIDPLFDEAEATAHADGTAEPEESEASEVAAHKRKKRGKRKPLPANLPRERCEYDLPDAEKICQIPKIPMVKIGEKITEQCETHHRNDSVIRILEVGWSSASSIKRFLNNPPVPGIGRSASRE